MVNVVKLATGVMAFHISTDFDQDIPFVNILLKFYLLVVYTGLRGNCYLL